MWPPVCLVDWKGQTPLLWARHLFNPWIRDQNSCYYIAPWWKMKRLWIESVPMSPLKVISLFFVLTKAKDRIRSKVKYMGFLPKNINCEWGLFFVNECGGLQIRPCFSGFACTCLTPIHILSSCASPPPPLILTLTIFHSLHPWAWENQVHDFVINQAG